MMMHGTGMFMMFWMGLGTLFLVAAATAIVVWVVQSTSRPAASAPDVAEADQIPRRRYAAGEMRVSHADRQEAVQYLQRNAAAGRLTEQELTERTEAAARAVTHAELAALTNDLPTGGNPGWLSGNPVATGLIIAGIVVTVLIALVVVSMVAMMAFMGPSMGWHC